MSSAIDRDLDMVSAIASLLFVRSPGEVLFRRLVAGKAVGDAGSIRGG